ncbi:MAG: zinc protease [bacterium F082]|nr:MAG: zinc protease [bacterium F082]KWW31396.1 MAG: zinc protease [bacterium P201]
MKKLTLTLIAMLALSATMFAQQAMPVPFDPNVRRGKLENGLTYYIRHNEKPAQRANFYIAQKVGSILENDDQQGLAHFLEHMAFNGTKNFPGKGLLNYMEHNGVKFGENVNAWTSIEQTVYMLTNVPTTNMNLVDSCILILHDWSSFISLEGEEIDKERGVILEEMRQGQGAQMRIYEKMLPEIYPNSPYGHRLPIGTEEVVSGFKHDALRAYYHKWYRPDLQGIIIIGDVDVNEVENHLKSIFEDIPAPINPAERTRFQVADNAELIVSICTDPEETNYNISLYYKHDIVPFEERGDVQYWLKGYIDQLVSTMYNNRMEELTQKANPPFIFGYGYYGTFFVSDTKDAWTGLAYAKDKDGIDEALTAIVAENKRMQQYGFTASEFERAKADLMKQIENQYDERDKQETSRYFYPILNHFLTNEPLLGIENEYMLLGQIMPMLPVEAINQYAKELIREDNIVITLTAPEKEGEVLPTKEELLALFNKAKEIEVEPYKETVSNEPLIATLPVKGAIESKKHDDTFDATILTLKNGIKVIYKPTHFKDDEILMSAYSFGGYSVMDQSDPYTLQQLNELAGLGGLGNFSAIDLPKVLAGKKVHVSGNVNTFTENVSGSCSVKDLETMMQLIYLSFGTPRSDEEAYQSFITRTKAMLANIESNPDVAFSDNLIFALFDNHPLRKRMKAEDYDKVDYAKALKLYADRFKDANNFVFTFVGNIDPETFEPMVEQYIGALKTKKNDETWTANVPAITDKDVTSHYTKAMENPKVTCYMVYNGDMEFNRKNQLTMQVLSDVMDIVYTEKIREDEGGTYGVGVNASLNNRPKESFMFLIGFNTNKEMYEKLMGIAKAELQNMANQGPRPEDLKKVKEFLIKKHAEDLENNRYWMNCIQTQDSDGYNPMANYNEIINGITSSDVANMAKAVLNGYKKEVVQIPE